MARKYCGRSLAIAQALSRLRGALYRAPQAAKTLVRITRRKTALIIPACSMAVFDL
jgi:hypothetical protein